MKINQENCKDNILPEVSQGLVANLQKIYIKKIEAKKKWEAKLQNIIIHPKYNMTIEEFDDKVRENFEKVPGNGYKCLICGKTSSQLGHVRPHVESHLQKLFYCIDCEKTSPNRRMMQIHECAASAQK